MLNTLTADFLPAIPCERERFLPSILPSDRTYPFKVSVRTRKQRGLISFTLDTPVRWTRGIVAALELLSSLARDLQRGAEHGERTRRLDVEAVAWRKRQRVIYRAYSTYRRKGMLHRAAVRALVADPRFQDLSWGFPQFNFILPSASVWRP